ncbi:hypothetical protein S1OALGB6SA_1796 [Olavius algarvensis spirochete endosymbiont]|uniref:dephospho-CoA kinase n=1 Tax=Olavius algarvensis spirochete endosymbiont TaxID=260710 RepID=UPI000F0ED1F6|nr:dephospho-CoA kinase [Olavius algarvensis spirochete endosymbiont]VDB00708.1 hypothetical protein S1OALGB6SA_1796 [Olavius algarvensis spirochete endosymbiont]
MILIGIVGRCGSGKNYVAGILEELGFRSLDLDIVGHQCLITLSKQIEDTLGPGLLVNGVVDRVKLGRLVFSDSLALRRLEELTYPCIELEVRKWLAAYSDSLLAIHGVNLHKTSLAEECSAFIWIEAGWIRRFLRVLKRDGRSLRDTWLRFRSQKELNSKFFPKRAEIYKVRNARGDAYLRFLLGSILPAIKGERVDEL